MNEAYCNGKSPNLPSLEVVKKVEKPIADNENMNWLLHIYYARQDYDMCRLLIQRQLIENINADYLYYVQGLIQKKEGNLIDAIKSFQKAIDLNSNNLDIYKEIGKTLFSMGRFKQAMGVFREAEKMATQSRRPDPEIFHYIAEILQWNITQKSDGTTTSELDATSSETTNETNSTNLNSNLMNDVKEYYHKAVQIGKKYESYKKLAEIYRNERDYAKAIEILENCLQIVPENQEILTEIGVLYLKVNDPQRAFDKLIEVTSINDRFAKGLLAFGAILQSRNDINGALAKYTKISGEDYECSELWNNIGLCFFKKNKLIVAISCLRKSVWLSPTNYNILYNLSLIYINARQYASAFLTLAAALNLRKDSAESYMLLAICLQKLEDYENAFTAFERAANLPDGMKNPLILLNFSTFCYEREKYDLAIKHFNDFVDVAQDFVLPIEYRYQATRLKEYLLQQEEFEGNPNATSSVELPSSLFQATMFNSETEKQLTPPTQSDLKAKPIEKTQLQHSKQNENQLELVVTNASDLIGSDEIKSGKENVFQKIGAKKRKEFYYHEDEIEKLLKTTADESHLQTTINNAKVEVHRYSDNQSESDETVIGIKNDDLV